MKADADGLAGPADLPVLGEVAYAAGHLDVTIEAWERAYALCVEAGDTDAAAGAAVRVAMHLLFDTALMAPVRGWLARAERLLGRSAARRRRSAWLAAVRAYERMLTGDLPDARPWARRAIELGSKHDPAACALGRVAEARLLILDGDVEQGLALLDEVGVATVSGDLDPLSTGVVYCELVCALQGLGQYDVAEEWTEAMERWCKTDAIGSLHGRCRVHRAEILRLRGSCSEAETEALERVRGAAPVLATRDGMAVERARADPTSQGRHRRRRGGLSGCSSRRLGSAARSRARAAGPRRRSRGGRVDPRRARASDAGALQGAAAGHRSAAGAAARGAGRDRDRGRRHRSSALGRRRVDAGGRSVRRARRWSPARALAHGRVRLAEGDAADAERFCAEAARLWSEVGAPYEAALARAGFADALRASGNEQPGRSGARSGPHGPRPDRGRADSRRRGVGRAGRRSGGASRHRRQHVSPGGRLLVGESSRGAPCECETSRASGTSRGCSPTLAVSSTCSTSSPPKAAGSPGPRAAVRPACRTQVPAMPVRCSTREPRTRTGGASPRSRTTSSRRAPSGTPSEATQADAERDFLVRELSRAVGLGGRDRRAASTSERARVSVTRADPPGDSPGR